MKKQLLFSLVCILLAANSCVPNQDNDWNIKSGPLSTEWAHKIDIDKPWDKYPRPAMVRNDWLNLNGLWDFAITDISAKPDTWERKILLPYPVESALSGIMERVNEEQLIWYKKDVELPAKWKKKRVLINFEASDWETTLYVDGKVAGTHKGGYDPFSFDISEFVVAGEKHEILISVWDPTDKGPQPRGKQVSDPHGIWYTPTSGIWQTVWMEPVDQSYIKSFRIFTDIEQGTIELSPHIYNSRDGIETCLRVIDKGEVIAEVREEGNNNLLAKLDNFQLWTPDNPKLYDLEIELFHNGSLLDKISSYTGLRKISLGKTGDSYTRILLNNEFLFQNGPLDQGFWPDGLYTPPSDEAMVYDLEMTKKMGFNMLRKHVKVENRRFYTWCDKIGLLVWQDLPSGDKYIGSKDPDIEKSAADKKQFRSELTAMIETKFNNPSIVIWVPFNEGWGQFETGKTTDYIKELDPTRLVNSASGWTNRGTGDMLDIHHYPDPRIPAPEEMRAIVLGEFGGLGLPVQDHTWEKKNWGYRTMESTEELLEKYEDYYQQVYSFIEEGLSAVVYTQTTDVETETNGLMTYDRAVDKMGFENVFMANKGILPPALKSECRIFTDSYLVELYTNLPDSKIYYTLDGSDPDSESSLYTAPKELNSSSDLNVIQIHPSGKSRIKKYIITKVELQDGQDAEETTKGLNCSIYEGKWTELPDFKLEEAISTNISLTVSTKAGDNNDNMGLVFEGYLKIEEDGIYGLWLNSDDGSRLYLNDEHVIENDGVHGMREVSNYMALANGYHKIRIEYFQGTGGLGLEFLITDPSGDKKVIAAKSLFH
ncbi:MAG: PA14 domain-containing protein [Bacteroidales bacterium]|nr:PA14 domain-containing protein [Bacteroidales bacterium]